MDDVNRNIPTAVLLNKNEYLNGSMNRKPFVHLPTAAKESFRFPLGVLRRIF